MYSTNYTVPIHILISDGDLEFDYLHNFGPRFKKLADMYGEQPDSSDEDDAIEDSEMDGGGPPRESIHHLQQQYPPHQHFQQRAGSHLSDRLDDQQLNQINQQVNGLVNKLAGLYGKAIIFGKIHESIYFIRYFGSR